MRARRVLSEFAVGIWMLGGLVVTFPLSQQTGIPTRPAVDGRSKRASQALDDVRRRLGVLGRSKILEVEGSVVAGFNGVTGQLMQPRKLLIQTQLPRLYLRVESDGQVVIQSGFCGTDSLSQIREAGRDSHATKMTGGTVEFEQARAAPLLLGLAAFSVGDVRPVDLRADISSEVIEFTFSGQNHLELRLGSDGLPVEVRLREAVSFPGAPLSDQERRAGVIRRPNPPVSADVVWAFEERRNDQGLLLPGHVTRTANGVLLEDIRIQRGRVDATIDTACGVGRSPNDAH